PRLRKMEYGLKPGGKNKVFKGNTHNRKEEETRKMQGAARRCPFAVRVRFQSRPTTREQQDRDQNCRRKQTGQNQTRRTSTRAVAREAGCLESFENYGV